MKEETVFHTHQQLQPVLVLPLPLPQPVLVPHGLYHPMPMQPVPKAVLLLVAVPLHLMEHFAPHTLLQLLPHQRPVPQSQRPQPVLTVSGQHLLRQIQYVL